MKNSLRAGILVLFSILLFGADVCAQITAAFTFTPASGCSPQVVSFTNTSSGSYSSSSWSFGNSTSSTLTNPSTSYTSPGTYTVTLTVSGTSGSKSVSHTVIIYPAPTVSLSFTPSLGCDPVNVSFTPTVTPGTPGSVTYYWDFGDGLNSTNTNPSHAYSTSSSTSSTYTPKVTVTNSQGCSTTFISTNTVTVNARPQGSFTANPANNCNLPAIVGFSNSVTGNGPFTVGWTFGDNGTASGNGPTHVYNGAGKYDVVMYMTDANGCKDSVVKKKYVSVKANNASFTGPAIGCDSTSVSFTNTTPGSSASTWDFGDGTGYFYGSTAAHYFTAAGVYTVMLLSTDSSCLDTVRHTITIQPKPIIWITNDTPCQTPATYTFTGKSNTPGMTYTWSFASGGTATGTTATHYYPIGTIESATLIGTSPGGCIDTFKNDSLLIYDAFIFGGTRPKGGCVPLTVVFNADLYSSIPYTPWKIGAYGPYPSKTVSWHWVFDGNPTLTSNDSTPSFTFTTTGIHYATLTITTANGCTFTSVIQVPVGDKMPPSFTGGPDTTCVRQLIHLQNTTADTSITFYWRWGNGDETGQVQGDYFYRRPGTFTVTLISDWNGCYDSVSRQNLITILPSDANFNDSIYCWPSLTVNFTDISIGATTHLWVFGDGSPNTTVQSPQHIYPGPGKYPATQITWNSTYGCRDTVTDTIRIIPINLDFKASDTTLCQRDTLHLTASYSGPNEHLWAWSIDGLINPSDSVNQVFKDSMLPNTGYHTVKLFLVTYKRCRDSVVKNNYIIVSHPVAGFSATPTIGCAPLTVTFKDTTAFTPGTALGNSYWRFGNGDTARNSNVYTTAYYPLDGIYTVKFVVTDWNGCPDSVFKVGYIESRKPNAFYQVNALDGCVGNVFNFTNISVGATSNLATYWSFGDGDSANTFNTTHIYKAAGAYTVKMAVFDSTGCSDTMIKTITITRPTAAFSVSDSIAVCPPLIVSFTNGSTGGGKYAWDFKNTATSSVTNPTSTFGTPGVYSVMLVVTDGNGCKDTATHTVRVLGYSGAFDYPEKIGCNPLTVHFTSKIVNVADSVIWDFADGTTLSGTGLTSMHTYLNPGAYVPKLIFSDKKSGCKASSIGLDTIKVDAVRAGFKALPPCEKTAIQLVDTSFSYFSAMKDWRWNFGTAGSAIGNPVNRIYNSAGQYPVTLIATNATGCKDTLTRMITIYPLPIVVAMDDTAVCIPDAITLFASGAKTYTWAPPTFLSCTGCPNPLASPNVPISYIVTGTDSIGCQNIDTVKVGIQTKTTFVVADKGEICLGDTIRLFAAGATIYNWAPPDGLDSPNIAKPMASPKTNTTYIVTAKEGSCLASTHSVQVTVHPLPTVDAGGDLKVIAGRAVLLQASGTGIARVKWRDDSTLSCLECFAPEAKPRVTTTYQITAYTEFGCTSTDSMTVVVLCDGSQLFIPNTFSPNGDGHNDVFFPRGDGIKIIKSFRIYSRWGELMYSKENVRVNDESAGWDGIHNGKILTPDVFVYVLEASCDTGEPIIFKGDVTLLK